MNSRIALVGDYRAEVTAHRAIPLALELARREAEVTWEWVPTTRVGENAQGLKGFSAAWLVPASPYADFQGALATVRWAREGNLPFLGTCGGFQHALIEVARSVAGIEADHAESLPHTKAPLISALACSLVEGSGRIYFRKGSLLHLAYGRDWTEETYHCRYGLNPAYVNPLESAGIEFSARDESGEIRGAELRFHPFFVGTLFQPERLALQGVVPPIVKAFVSAVTAQA